MKKMLLTVLIIFGSSVVFAEIEGVSTKTPLLQQLQVSLGMTVSEMNLPTSVVSKLPVTNEVEEIKPSFMSAWTQVTFLACKRAINLGRLELITEEEPAKEWIKSFAGKSWGVLPTDEEVDEIYQAGYKSENTSNVQKMSFSCSMALSSPKVYVIAK